MSRTEERPVALMSVPDPDDTPTLREWREHLGLHQEQIASLVDVSQPTVSRWENEGALPRGLDRLEQAAAAYRIDVPQLLAFLREAELNARLRCKRPYNATLLAWAA